MHDLNYITSSFIGSAYQGVFEPVKAKIPKGRKGGDGLKLKRPKSLERLACTTPVVRTKQTSSSWSHIMAQGERCGCCAGCSQRVLVYCWLALNTAICAAFAALAIVNSRHMTDSQLYGGGDEYGGQVQLSGVIIACILGTVMVLVYSVISLLLVIRNMFSRTPLAGFWYGVLLSSSLHVSMFMLLAALVLTSFNSTIDRGVNSATFPLGWSSVYKVTFALAYLLVATFLVQFFLFWLCKSAFLDQAITTVVVESRTPSAAGSNAVVAVIRKEDVKNAKKAAKAAQKAMEFNKAFGGQAETIV